MSTASARFVLAGALLVLLVAGCGRSARHEPTAGASGGTANAGGDADGEVEGGAGGSSPGACCETGRCPCDDLPQEEGLGVVPMHRLRSAEYSNTINDLFALAAAAPMPDEAKPYEAVIFDAAPWLDATRALLGQLALRGTWPSPFECVGVNSVDRACALASIDAFGLRAFRRPILDEERQAFIKVYDELAPTDGGRGAFGQVLRAMLLSPAFLFHVELSDTPDSAEPELLDSYALAARLSFALWRTTPDQALLTAAAADLTKPGALNTALERLAQDQRATQLASGLSDVWLRVDRLAEHQVDAAVFPLWEGEPMRQAMLDSGRGFLWRFWREPQPLRGLMTLEQDQRAGWLEQAAFLTLTSTARRTSATFRGTYVLDRLLCLPVPIPPPSGDDMDLGPDYPAGMSERQALESLVTDPACKACHVMFDPIGHALGNFDAIGTYRTVDSQGKAVDATVQLWQDLAPDGAPVTGSRGVSLALADSSHFHGCVSRQLASYMIHREVTAASDPRLVTALTDRVADQATLPELVRAIALSDEFRYRRVPSPAP